ncbi:flagellar biosynthetic protein FliR [Cytobacillus sp. IB215316]|uniref:flagellar biosynthetic protein FliR n=1 Tax=Cytobacillus sp. IB215316 TaxID=3097354 RepID=UPI002A127C6A|nr:flagellar biosynthetic protein FliR [Cytobacillus sp. IB215316]MDX8362238.1 flagellar biosynthetic protein FliR [Cytobacillus sp. IB215316]
MNDMITLFPMFLLIFIRISAFFVTIPIFSYRNIPNTLKIGLSFFLAWIMVFTIDPYTIPIDVLFIAMILKEALIGILIGFTAYIIFSAIQTAGGFIDFQMGFAIANVIDPQTGAQSPLMGQYLYTFALLFLLSVDAHHLLLDGIFNSYQFIPIDQTWVSFGDSRFSAFLIQTMSYMFIIAFQMALPIVGSLFLVDIALGIMARTMPQLNIFVVGIPIKIIVSFVMLIVIMASFIYLVRDLFENVLVTLRTLMRILGGV